MTDLLTKAANIKLLALDVDGILSDGKITFDGHQVESKHFHVQDGLGITALQKYGIQVAIITGRTSPMVAKRADELGIAHVLQGRDDKLTALKELLTNMTEPIGLHECAYMGDDLPDIRALQAVGFAATVPNAHSEVINRVDMVTTRSSGQGAVREVCDLILKATGNYQDFIDSYIN